MKRGALIGVVLAALLVGCGGSSEPEATGPSPMQQREEAAIRKDRAEERRVDAEVRANVRQYKREAKAKPAPDPEPRPKPEPSPPPEAAGGFTGKYASRYEEDKVICGLFPESQIAKEFHVSPSSGPVEIAEAYAEGFYGRFEQAAFEGCFEGLHP